MCTAYDRVSWSFLKTVLISMNFGSNWVHMIMECVFSGSPTQEFLPTRGVREGDQIFPYLFLFCANILSIALIQAEGQKKIKGIKLGRSGRSFTHLFYVDDSLFFFQNDRNSLNNLKGIILWYCSLSGQSINFMKSDLYCFPNMHPSIQESLTELLQVNLVHNPSKYLGLNFKLRDRRVVDFEDLVERLQTKLQGQSAKLLSQASRATLISVVLQSMPLYTFSCFKVPETICNKLDATIRDFWWGHKNGTRKMHLIGWDKLCTPKSKGGLGFKRFTDFNQAMLAKRYWKIQSNPNSLLARTYKTKYFPRTSLKDYTPKPFYSWTWRAIANPQCIVLHEGRWIVGAGHQIPLNYLDWFQAPRHKLREVNLTNGIVANLLVINSKAWNCNLLRKLYLYPTCIEIMKTPIPKTDYNPDKLVWKHSSSGIIRGPKLTCFYNNINPHPRELEL